ncbi:MAG: flagellar biosynthetic protein FliO [Lachnospiraceae bacterium]|nr:flagellar biosynthetic protein FliO [Lachnospiraceae bacterium]MCR5776966.1 flagellar biosynthetic protein FliO [Lachnospiraceae bacterium]
MTGILLAGWENAVQLITAILIFVFVLGLSYVTTRFAARQAKKSTMCRNIEVIDTFPITQSKYIQIVRCGTKYLAIAVTKESITMLTELGEDDLDLTNVDDNFRKLEFKDFMDQAKKVLKKGGIRYEKKDEQHF